MNMFNYEEWINIIEDVYSEVKPYMKELYSVKDTLDQELSFLFVDKVYTFYQLLDTLQQEHSLESPNTELGLISFPSDLQKLMTAYSAVLKFEKITEDLTGKKVEIPEQIWSVWYRLKNKLLDDFDFTIENKNQINIKSK